MIVKGSDIGILTALQRWALGQKSVTRSCPKFYTLFEDNNVLGNYSFSSIFNGEFSKWYLFKAYIILKQPFQGSWPTLVS